MSLSVLAPRKSTGLANVMKQSRPTQRQLAGGGGNYVADVGVDIVNMVAVVLFEANGRRKFRDHLGQDGGKPKKIFRIRQGQKFT